MPIYTTGSGLVPPNRSRDRPFKLRLEVEKIVKHLAIQFPSSYPVGTIGVRLLQNSEYLCPPQYNETGWHVGTGAVPLLRDGQLELAGPPYVISIEAYNTHREEAIAFRVHAGTGNTTWDQFEEHIRK